MTRRGEDDRVTKVPQVCIYCEKPGPFSPEHYLPACLGRFENYDPLLDRVCRACNIAIGSRLETQFCRAGPTGFFRWMLGVRGREGLPESPFRRGAGGAPPIVMWGKPSWSPYDLLAELDPGTQDARALPQIIFESPDGEAHPVPAFEWMRGRPDLFLEHLRQRGLDGAKPKFVVALSPGGEWVLDMARAAGGNPSGSQAVTSPPERVPLTATLQVTPAYFQAVAKIGLHYTLKMFPDVTGMEPEFNAIKDFIKQGGPIGRFIRERPDQFVANFRAGRGPTHWMHILAAERGGGQFTAFTQFFIGPHGLLPGYEVYLGADWTRIHRPAERHGHYFVITDPTASQGPVGKMEDAQPAHWIWVPW